MNHTNDVNDLLEQREYDSTRVKNHNQMHRIPCNTVVVLGVKTKQDTQKNLENFFITVRY